MELYLDLMTTRTGYLIKHTLPSARYNRWSLSLRDMRRGSPGRIMLCDATGDATWRCYLEDFNLLSSTCCKSEAARSVVFDRTSYPPLILAFCSSVHRYCPLHRYPCICSVDSCLRLLWMSTHGCFAPSFPPFPLLLGRRNQMLEPRS